MSQHVSETCNESSGLWLPLTEYAVKSGVSLSTIRRKIKSNSIPFRLEKGRYLILFEDGKASESGSHTIERNVDVLTINSAPAAQAARQTVSHRESPKESGNDERALPLVEKAVRMVSQAFEHALKEKDERIRLLEKRNSELDDRLGELKTLVRVLEEKYEVRY